MAKLFLFYIFFTFIFSVLFVCFFFKYKAICVFNVIAFFADVTSLNIENKNEKNPAGGE